MCITSSFAAGFHDMAINIDDEELYSTIIIETQFSLM